MSHHHQHHHRMTLNANGFCIFSHSRRSHIRSSYIVCVSVFVVFRRCCCCHQRIMFLVYAFGAQTYDVTTFRHPKRESVRKHANRRQPVTKTERRVNTIRCKWANEQNSLHQRVATMTICEMMKSLRFVSPAPKKVEGKEITHVRRIHD